jgi:hypothetical protein
MRKFVGWKWRRSAPATPRRTASPLPLLPSGPDGVHGWPSRGDQHGPPLIDGIGILQWFSIWSHHLFRTHRPAGIAGGPEARNKQLMDHSGPPSLRADVVSPACAGLGSNQTRLPTAKEPAATNPGFGPFTIIESYPNKRRSKPPNGRSNSNPAKVRYPASSTHPVLINKKAPERGLLIYLAERVGLFASKAGSPLRGRRRYAPTLSRPPAPASARTLVASSTHPVLINKKAPERGLLIYMAERVGFEPTIRFDPYT